MQESAYRVLRGQRQIGGSITEIRSDTTRIFVDFGAELPAASENTTDAEMIRLIEKEPPDAVLFTHIHGDHIGLLSAIPEQVRYIYVGKVARQMLLNIRETLLRIPTLSAGERQKLQREWEILTDDQRMRVYENGKDIVIGDIICTPIRVDHSVFDAYMLKFSVQGKTILHTGDFRAHGRLGAELISALKAYAEIDILIMEGTMLSRQKEQVLSETDLQAKATALMRRHKYAFLICSSTNLESLASFYQAALVSGRENGRKPPFIVNSYVKRQLELFTREVGEKEQLREFTFYRSYTIQDGLQAILPNGKTQRQHMIDEGFLMLVGTSDYYRRIMDSFRPYDPVLIYSLWDGYLSKGKPYADPALIDLVEDWKGACVHLHTSGHAAGETLAEVIALLAPREAIVPIHTEYPEGLLDLDIPDELKARIKG